jgi:hypothetical protein
MRGRPKNPEVQKLIQKCKEIGISYNSYLRRLQMGWSKEEAISIGKVGAYLRLADGTPVYSYLKDEGKYSSFLKFIHLGSTVEEALEAINNLPGRTKYYRDGMSLRQYCKKNGLNYGVEMYKEKKNVRLSKGS